MKWWYNFKINFVWWTILSLEGIMSGMLPPKKLCFLFSGHSLQPQHNTIFLTYFIQLVRIIFVYFQLQLYTFPSISTPLHSFWLSLLGDEFGLWNSENCQSLSLYTKARMVIVMVVWRSFITSAFSLSLFQWKTKQAWAGEKMQFRVCAFIT